MNEFVYKRKNPLKIALWILGGITLAVLFAFIFGTFIMLLWNWLMPAIFALPEINYLQAVGILVLARLLVGGFGHKRHHGFHRHRPFGRFNGNFDRKEAFKKRAENWKYYHEFWKDEGEAAFDEYKKKRQEQKQ